MNIYNYHQTTKEYLGQSLADKDPLTDDNWLIPAHATTIQPPVAGQNKVAVFAYGSWAVVDDYRGTNYWLDGKWYLHETIGPLPTGCSFDAPPPTAEEIAEQQNAINEAEVQRLLNRDGAIARLLITLIDSLLDKVVIAGSDFTPEEISLYQAIKAKVQELY